MQNDERTKFKLKQEYKKLVNRSMIDGSIYTLLNCLS